MEKFTELLSSEGLSEDQAACCRDIRRRGKNKVNSVFEGFGVDNSEDIQNKETKFLEGNHFLGDRRSRRKSCEVFFFLRGGGA